MKKCLVFLTIISFLSLNVPAFAYYPQVSTYLCELGIQFYNSGDYANALHEFNKALLANPDNPLALSYIGKITQEGILKPEEPELTKVLPVTIPSKSYRDTVSEYLDKIEKEMQLKPQAVPPAEVLEAVALPEKIPVPERLFLDESVMFLKMPIEIELGKSIIIEGQDLRRFLITSPNVLSGELKSDQELLLTGKEFGHTYVHIWDKDKRWTLEFLTVPPKPEGPTLEELQRLQEEKASTFKLRYYFDWSSFESGRRINELNRLSYAYTHGLSLDGPMPYGDLDSRLTVRSLANTTDLTYFTLGLTNGRFRQFREFSLRFFDFSTDSSMLVSPITALRGAKFSSPAFNKKLDYTVFWGKEGGGRFGNLSPGLTETKDSFLSGLNLSVSPTKKFNQKFSVIRGWGIDRPQELNSYGYDLVSTYNFKNLKLNYDIGHDSETFAHLFTANYSRPKFNLISEFRDISRDFKTMTGTAYRLGEIGVLSTLYYKPTEKVNMTSRLDVFKDRLFPNPDNPDRLNENFYWDMLYSIGKLSSLRFDYTLQNELGRLADSRSHSAGLGYFRTFEWLRRINTYINYRHQENKSFSSHSSDFINEKIILGLRFSLIGDLYYYANKEYNWLEERLAGNRTQPEAFETGVDWNSRISNTPFYGNFRCIYREEKDTASPLSFLSGEDYLEGYAELAYRPENGAELYCSSRVRNVWAGGNPNVNKRVEADFRAGMRYLWDTGVRWESIGSIEGYVFKDYNADGLRQRDEPPVEGVKVWLRKDKSLDTDIFGYFKFGKVKAKKAFVTIDTATIPSGFNLTVPATQEVLVTHAGKETVNFGIASRSEIIGVAFEDVDLDNQLGVNDIPVRGVVLGLEEGSKTLTNDFGRYSFRNINTGMHILTIDLNSVPKTYLPTVSLSKEIELFEGISYNYNIPLKRVKK
jgi:hypothetical protein